jgi:hypothetical protein
MKRLEKLSELVPCLAYPSSIGLVFPSVVLLGGISMGEGARDGFLE